MLLPRALYSTPPLPKTSRQNNPTLLVSWWCTGFALAIILVRIAGRYVRTERLFSEDKIMALSILPLVARMALVHLVLIWGTNNTMTKGLSPIDIRNREIGSRLVLASRIMYAMFLWIAKLTILEFLKRLTSQVWKRSYEIGVQLVRWFLVVTFIAVVIATLAECQPFNSYWQVVPDAKPKCRQGMAQLIIMGTSDVITDLILVGFPIPIVLLSGMPLKRKISLVLLFALSLILVGITIYRVVGVIDRHSDQQFRTLVASLEILAAAAVSNALVLGSFVRDRGAKKQRFRFGSTGGNSSLDRSSQIPHRAFTHRNWGSDADLVGDLGIRCNAELSEEKASIARRAPMALPNASQAKSVTPAPVGQKVESSTKATCKSFDENPESNQPAREAQPSPSDVPSTPRGISFFDVGRLLGESERATKPPQVSGTALQPTNTHLTAEASSSAGPRRGSQALLQDIGGLLAPQKAEHEIRPASGKQDVCLADILRDSEPNQTWQGLLRQSVNPTKRKGSMHGLQDVGGLLS